MWPLKKKEVKAPEPDKNLEMIRQFEAWRGIGGEFDYLGRRMVVSGHWRIVGGFPGGLYFLPCLQADYADDHGVIHNITFSARETMALIDAQPNAELSRRQPA